MTSAWQFFDNLQTFFAGNTFDVMVQGILVYLAAFWIALIIWVTRDIIHRTNSILFQIFSITLNIFLPVFGLIIYLIIRPSKTLWERYYEEVELRALAEEGLSTCPKCQIMTAKEHLFCGSCGETLKKRCEQCTKPYEISFHFCPFCGHKEGEVVPRKRTKKT